MANFIIRLDDMSNYRNKKNWDRMIEILDQYDIKPLVGVIPNCEDPVLKKYDIDDEFWENVIGMQKKGYDIALHGYNHVYITNCGGINPVNHASEFAGLKLEEQKDKFNKAVQVFKLNNVIPTVFFAPSHTYDENTLLALKECTDIRIVSDTIASDVYKAKGLYFVPVQSGRIRNYPVKLMTACYHPNTMTETDFIKLEKQIPKMQEKFTHISDIQLRDRKYNNYDRVLSSLYFILLKVKRIISSIIR
jgi:predicted deacetylase